MWGFHFSTALQRTPSGVLLLLFLFYEAEAEEAEAEAEQQQIGRLPATVSPFQSSMDI
mgnify:CR=1 FL=1